MAQAEFKTPDTGLSASTVEGGGVEGGGVEGGGVEGGGLAGAATSAQQGSPPSWRRASRRVSLAQQARGDN